MLERKFYLVKRGDEWRRIGPTYPPVHEGSGNYVALPDDAESAKDYEVQYVDVDGETVLQPVKVQALVDARLATEAQNEVDRKWDKMRQDRNFKLGETDKYMVSDYPISASNKTAMETYRQALRDLPSNISDIDNVTWPTKPEV